MKQEQVQKISTHYQKTDRKTSRYRHIPLVTMSEGLILSFNKINNLGTIFHFPPRFAALTCNQDLQNDHSIINMKQTTQKRMGSEPTALSDFVRLLSAAEKSVFLLHQDGEEVAIISNEVSSQ